MKEAISRGSIECVDYDGEGNDLYSWHITDEEIVRCRDCEYVDPDLCDKYSKFEPDGFCAWGVKE